MSERAATPFALVTGASSGLGAEFARLLAADGWSLVLVARSAAPMEALATELRSSGVTVHVIPTDLADPTAPAALFHELQSRGVAIDVLINNAGFGSHGRFDQSDAAQQMAIVQVNVAALAHLTRLFLPAMVAAGRGRIMNVASVAGFLPGPLMAVYYASKAFVLSFSEALHEEVRGQGVRVAALCPGPTRTEFADVAGMADSPLFQRFASDAAAVVRDGLAALDRNEAVKVSGAMNAAMAGSIRLTPRTLARRIAGALQKRRG